MLKIGGVFLIIKNHLHLKADYERSLWLKLTSAAYTGYIGWSKHRKFIYVLLFMTGLFQADFLMQRHKTRER